MKSSQDLKSLRQKYYNLIDNINSSIYNLKKVPSELESVDSILLQGFTVEDEIVVRNRLSEIKSGVKENISKLESNISTLEIAIRKLNDQILAAELEEKMGGAL